MATESIEIKSKTAQLQDPDGAAADGPLPSAGGLSPVTPPSSALCGAQHAELHPQLLLLCAPERFLHWLCVGVGRGRESEREH